MGRVHIRRVTVQAFRAFVDKQSTNVLPSTGLVGLRGFNKDTGGSSGAGKSSVAYAIAYAFDFLPFSASAQQNWNTDVPMQVELELDTPEGPAILRRGKETSLTWNGQVYRGSIKVVNEAIAKMWGGVSPELVKALVFKQQKNVLKKPDRFLSMKDSERKEFLSMLLGLEEVETQIAEAVKRSNTLEVEAQKLEAVIQALEGQLHEPARPQLEDLALLYDEQKDLESLLGGLRSELAAKQNELERAMRGFAMEQAALAKERSSFDFVVAGAMDSEMLAEFSQADRDLVICNERLAAATRAEAAEAAALADKATKLLDIASRFKGIAAKRPQIQRAIEVIDRDLCILADAKCQTCQREWEGAETEIATKEEARRGLIDQLGACSIAEENMEVKQQEYEEAKIAYQSFKSPVVVQLTEIRQKLLIEIAAKKANVETAKKLARARVEKEWAERVAEFEKRKADTLKGFEDAVADSTARLRDVETRLSALKSRIASSAAAKAMYEAALASYEAGRNRIQVQKYEHRDLIKKAGEEADYAQMMKGFLGAIFDETLAMISVETNEILRSIPNTPTTTVAFVSEVQTAKGATRQEIRPIVTKNGVVIDLESGVSGGQMESVELAVDLSVAKVIGQRTGVRPGFMIFDESFSAHCLPVKQACLAVLAAAAQDALVLVVDHAAELREGFSAFIDVESERDVSRFV